MKLHIFRHLWGVDPPWDQDFVEFAQKGYHGVEVPLSLVKDIPAFVNGLSAHGFQCIPMIFTSGQSVEEHIASFRTQVHDALVLKPTLINSQSGVDAFTLEQSRQFFRDALRIEAEAGVPIAHETHRGRILFNPWITAQLLDDFADLKLCCDFSHWVCVSERLIDDQIDVIRGCAKRAIHVHARVGYPEGPQVPDPRAPEYAAFVEAHERWWDIIWETQANDGQAVSTLTAEFGPPPYLHTLPHTNVPVADLREICDWQADRLRTRFDLNNS